MSERINTLKLAEAAQSDSAILKNKIRLHDAAIIRAKSPAFFEAVRELAKEYCSELRREFPNTPKRKCHVDYSPDGFVIRNDGPLPRRSRMARLNVEGQCVDLFDGVKKIMQEEPLFSPKGSIRIVVTPEEDLEFEYDGQSYSAPEDLAWRLVEFVCEIKSPVTAA